MIHNVFELDHKSRRPKIVRSGVPQTVYKLEETDHNPANFHDAMDKALEWGEKIPIGLFYRNPHPPPSLDAQDPGLQSGVLVRQSLGATTEQRRKCIEEST